MIFAQQQPRKQKTQYPRPALGVAYIAPRSDLERQIATMWRDLLGITEIGIDDNFFEMGGNSLIGLDLVTRLRRELDRPDVPLNLLYEAPTIGHMAAHLQVDQHGQEMTEQRLSRGQLRRQKAKERRRS